MLRFRQVLFNSKLWCRGSIGDQNKRPPHTMVAKYRIRKLYVARRRGRLFDVKLKFWQHFKSEPLLNVYMQPPRPGHRAS